VLLFCFSYDDYFALVFYIKQINSARLVVASFDLLKEEKNRNIFITAMEISKVDLLNYS